MSIVITGTGSYIPERIIAGKEFQQHEFYSPEGVLIMASHEEIWNKFVSITGIEERRYVQAGQKTSDIAFIAARRAIEDAGTDPETLDGIIVAHNYGDIAEGETQSDTVPGIAARVKHLLRIKNPGCVAFDILYGCPGWVQGVIIASQFLKNGAAKQYLIIGAETLSRLVDPHDRDSMIYADGAGAAVVEWKEDQNRGIIGMASQSHTYEEVYYLHFGESYKDGVTPGRRYIKMQGRKIYEFALNNVPAAMKACLDSSGASIDEVKKVFLHQANEKMDEAIIKRFFKLCGRENMPSHFMPMSIHKLGNSSVATIPTLIDLVRKGALPPHHLEEGDVILLASVGAGMHINAITYRV